MLQIGGVLLSVRFWNSAGLLALVLAGGVIGIYNAVQAIGMFTAAGDTSNTLFNPDFLKGIGVAFSLLAFCGLMMVLPLLSIARLPLAQSAKLAIDAALKNSGNGLGFFGLLQPILFNLAKPIPYGLGTAVFIVGCGIFVYVAYREVFERRGKNSPQVTAATIAAPEPAATS